MPLRGKGSDPFSHKDKKKFLIVISQVRVATPFPKKTTVRRTDYPICHSQVAELVKNNRLTTGEVRLLMISKEPPLNINLQTTSPFYLLSRTNDQEDSHQVSLKDQDVTLAKENASLLRLLPLTVGLRFPNRKARD